MLISTDGYIPHIPPRSITIEDMDGRFELIGTLTSEQVSRERAKTNSSYDK